MNVLPHVPVIVAAEVLASVMERVSVRKVTSKQPIASVAIPLPESVPMETEPMIVKPESVIACLVTRETCVIVRPFAPITVPAMEVANVTEPVPVMPIGPDLPIVVARPNVKIVSRVRVPGPLTVPPGIVFAMEPITMEVVVNVSNAVFPVKMAERAIAMASVPVQPNGEGKTVRTVVAEPVSLEPVSMETEPIAVPRASVIASPVGLGTCASVLQRVTRPIAAVMESVSAVSVPAMLIGVKPPIAAVIPAWLLALVRKSMS